MKFFVSGLQEDNVEVVKAQLAESNVKLLEVETKNLVYFNDSSVSLILLIINW